MSGRGMPDCEPAGTEFRLACYPAGQLGQPHWLIGLQPSIFPPCHSCSTRFLRVGRRLVTNSKFFQIRPTTRRKALFVLVAMFIFACLGLVTTLAAGRPLQLGLSTAILIGLGVGLLEEFYVQSEHGKWLRN